MSYGLMSFGIALGASVPVEQVIGEYTEDRERILGYGFRTIHRAAPEVGVTDLAADAGLEALASAAIEPAEIDLLVFAITDLTEHLNWDAAASLTHRLGACRAEAVLLTQGCTTGVAALDTVAGKFATHPGYQTALVVAANRTCEAYWNRMDTQPVIFSDGAVAAVARRGHPSLRWLTTEIHTNGQFADFFRLSAGGTAAPFGTASDGEAPRVSDAWDIMEFFDYDVTRFQAFAHQLDANSREVVDRACANAGIVTADLAMVFTLSDNVAAMTALAKLLDIPLERTNLELSAKHGHLGAADQLLALHQSRADGVLSDGDTVALLSRGRGMHWACTLIEV
jgi:3-oxoacyl-[acyl-carrier-protein] synthase III